MATSVRRRRRWTRPLGLVLGAGAVVVVVGAYRVPGGMDQPGTRVTMIARALGEFSLDPTLPFLATPALEPGSSTTSGQVRLSNISPRAHRVRIKPVITNHDLDSFLHVKIVEDETVLFDGVLEDLEAKTLPFVMDVGQQRVLKFSVRLPKTERTSLLGRQVDIEINFNIDQPGPRAPEPAEPTGTTG